MGRGPEETVILPPLVLASPTSYSYTKSLGRERLDSLRTTRSLRSTGIQGKEETRPRTVKQLLLERIGSAGSTLSFPRPGTRGEFLDPSKLPTPLERIWDRADEVAEATMLVHTEAELQMAEYSKIHDTLLREEERYDNLTVEHCKVTPPTPPCSSKDVSATRSLFR